jgi:hypothetical protein
LRETGQFGHIGTAEAFTAAVLEFINDKKEGPS